MLNYPFNVNARLGGPTLIYIDSEGSLIELRLNNYQAQSIITDWNNQPDESAEGEAPQMLNPPQGHVATYEPVNV